MFLTTLTPNTISSGIGGGGERARDRSRVNVLFVGGKTSSACMGSQGLSMREN